MHNDTSTVSTWKTITHKNDAKMQLCGKNRIVSFYVKANRMEISKNTAAYVSDTYYSPIIIGPFRTILAICSIPTFLDLRSRRSGYSPRFWECRRQQSASKSNSDELGTKQSVTALVTKICR
ncbi:hypothetical protein YC2023_043259 [Brassica napus]